MKYILLLTSIVITMFVGISPVYAQSSEVIANQKLPTSCDKQANEYRPYEELIVVDLSKVLNSANISSEDLSKQVFYELAFVQNNKISPFNALYLDKKIYFQSCNAVDISTRVKNDMNMGAFIVGSIDGTVGSELQSFIDNGNITSFKSASLKKEDGVYSIVNKSDCGEKCSSLTPAKSNWKQRKYEVSVEKVEISAKINQKDTVAAEITVKNNGQFPIYGDSTSPLYVLSKDSREFYHSTWVGSSQIQKNSGVLFPGDIAVLKFTLNSPLIPGNYEQKINLSVGDQVISGSDSVVKFQVENNNLKLLRVRPKDNLSFANIRETGSLTARELFRVDQDEVVILLKDEGAWLQIETKGGRTGWIYRPNIRFIN